MSLTDSRRLRQSLESYSDIPLVFWLDYSILDFSFERVYAS